MRRRNNKIPTHHLIVEAADWSQIMEARKDGVPWDELRTRAGLPALGMAIFSGSALAVHTLLEIGAPVQSEILFDKTFFSPLWSALEKRMPAVMDVLLQAGADPNEVHPESGAPIAYAAEKALTEETLVLCRHGASPNIDTAPSPLWIWIKNLTPQPDPTQDEWVFPDSRPVIALLKNGARIHSEDPQDPDEPEQVREASGGAFNEIEFAKRQWLRYPLQPSDQQHVRMTLSLMEKNLYAHTVTDSADRNDMHLKM